MKWKQIEHKDVLESLCWYDRRNPRFIKIDGPDSRQPGSPGCECDNCFFGRHELAQEILRLMGQEDASA